MRRKFELIIGAAALALGSPALAHDNSQDNRHDWQHEQLGQRHHDGHDQLDDEHAQAHDYALSRRDHRQVHRELEYQHDAADYRLNRQHQGAHRSDRWRQDQWRRYNGY